MGKMQRAKGSRGEREAVQLLRELGFTKAARTAQRTGRTGMPDIDGIPGCHIECKVGAHPPVRPAVKQALRDAQPGDIPVVLTKADRGEWMITILAQDFLEFMVAAADALEGEE